MGGGSDALTHSSHAIGREVDNPWRWGSGPFAAGPGRFSVSAAARAAPERSVFGRMMVDPGGHPCFAQPPPFLCRGTASRNLMQRLFPCATKTRPSPPQKHHSFPYKASPRTSLPPPPIGCQPSDGFNPPAQ